MKPLVITHKNCIDGCCAKNIFFTKFLNEADYLELDHYNLDPTKDLEADKYLAKILNKKNTTVYMADFCLETTLIESLLQNNNKVVVLDHHETAIKYIEPFEERISNGEKLNIHINFSKDNTKSGSMLSWEYLHPNIEPPISIKHVSAGDIWKFEFGEDTKFFYTGLMEKFGEPQNISSEQWLKLISIPDYHKKYISIGQPIREKYMQEVMSYVDKAEKVSILGKPGLMVEAPKKYTSDLGNVLAQQQNGEGFGLVYYEDPENGIVRCSLRSIAPFTVNDVASHFNGGGHAQASAFRCSNKADFLNIIQEQSISKKPKLF